MLLVRLLTALLEALLEALFEVLLEALDGVFSNAITATGSGLKLQMVEFTEATLYLTERKS